MKTCPKCKKELKETAKFCGGCGHKFPVPEASAAIAKGDGGVCPKCGNTLKPGAKFCGKCGTRIQVESKQLESVGNSGFVRWTMLPGQIAVKITEKEFIDYGKVRGLVIQDGTKALFFVNGKIVAELEAGSYKVDELRKEGANPTVEHKGGFLGFLQNAGAAAARAAAGLFRALTGNLERPAISAVLVRSTDFPLVFSVKDAITSGIRSEVGLHVLCKIANINEFYRNLLLDKKFVCFETMQSTLNVVARNQVNAAIASYTPDKVDNNPELAQTVLRLLQESVAGIYPFVEIKKVLQLTATHVDLENLRRMSEELYVSEQELIHLQKRNDFLNRLQAVKNEQETIELSADYKHQLETGAIEANFRVRKLEIYKQMELTQDEQDKFDLMLAAEKKLREAKTQEDVDVALHEYQKSGMLREQELDQLRHQGRMADLRNTQEYDMAEVKGELAVKREQDAYSDERRDKDAQFQDARRRAELELEKEEQQNQMDMLRQAQALRMERENAVRAHEAEMQKMQLDAKLENQRIYAGMTFEQIMAANPDISPEAAKALAQKFASDSKDELLRAREADMAKQSAQQMEMMRMMQQMSMAGMGMNQQHQKEMMDAKQAELERTRAEASRNEDRLLAGVQTSVTAAGVAFAGRANAGQQLQRRMEIPPSVPPTSSSISHIPAAHDTGSTSTGAKCPKCGAALEPDSSFCGECGTAL